MLSISYSLVIPASFFLSPLNRKQTDIIQMVKEQITSDSEIRPDKHMAQFHDEFHKCKLLDPNNIIL